MTSANSSGTDLTIRDTGVRGRVWSGQHFSLCERSIVTLALQAALGQDDRVDMHLRAGRAPKVAMRLDADLVKGD